MAHSRKIIVYIAASVDGYIAKPNDDLSFLNIVAREGEDYGYLDFVNSIDTVILGRRTYDWVMSQVPEFPHADKITFVITHTERPAVGSVQFYTGSLSELIRELKSTPGMDVFVDGGAEVVHALLQENLVDELILSVIPVALGDGIALFKSGRPEHLLNLTSVKRYESGLVQMRYSFSQND